MRFFNNLTMGVKFLITAAVILGIFVFISLSAVGTIIECHHACGALVGGAMTTKSLSQSAQVSFLSIVEAANSALLNAAAGNQKRAGEFYQAFNEKSQALSGELDGITGALARDPQVSRSIIEPLLQKVDDAKKLMNESYKPQTVKIYNAYLAGDLNAPLDAMEASSASIAVDLDTIFIEIENAGNTIFTNYVTHLEATIKKLQYFVYIAIVISIVIMIVLVRAITLNVKRTVHELNGIGTDLTRRLTIKNNDEIAQMGRVFNKTFDYMHSLVQNINTSASSLQYKSDELATNMTETAASITEITATIESIKKQTARQAEGVGKNSDVLQEVAGKIEILNGKIEEQSKVINESARTIANMLSGIEEIAKTIIENEENVKKLFAASELGRGGIQKVSSLIVEILKESEALLDITAVLSNIASQTNLLSMNAAIEAAHAGESGKGFAVVAGEIRKLAESSSTQSKTIASVLSKIKTMIDSIAKSNGEVMQRFEAIDSSIKTVAEHETVIRSSMEEQEAGSRAVLECMDSLKTISATIAESSEEIHAGSHSIVRESRSLQALSSEITNGMDEIAIGAVDINTAVSRVQGLSGENKKSIDSLVRGIAKFKC